jgi:hypothetical protein
MKQPAYRWQLVLTFLLWFVWDLAAVVQIKAVAGENLSGSMAMAWLIPFICWLSCKWLWDEKDARKSLGLVAFGATGSALATAVALKWSVVASLFF